MTRKICNSFRWRILKNKKIIRIYMRSHIFRKFTVSLALSNLLSSSHHVICAGGRDPTDWHMRSYFFPAVILLLFPRIVTSSGLTAITHTSTKSVKSNNLSSGWFTVITDVSYIYRHLDRSEMIAVAPCYRLFDAFHNSYGNPNEKLTHFVLGASSCKNERGNWKSGNASWNFSQYNQGNHAQREKRWKADRSL